jgi:hypothetical protein
VLAVSLVLVAVVLGMRGGGGIALVGSFFCWAAGLLCYFSGKGPDFKVWVVVSIFYILAGHGYEGGHRACCDV